jgi:hypothetical protein
MGIPRIWLENVDQPSQPLFDEFSKVDIRSKFAKKENSLKSDSYEYLGPSCYLQNQFEVIPSVLSTGHTCDRGLV